MFSKIGKTFRIKIWKKLIIIIDVSTNKQFEFEPLIAIQQYPNGKQKVLAFGVEAATYRGSDIRVINPFLHPRVIVDDFQIAELIFEHAIKSVAPKQLFFAPQIILELMEDYKGGLSSVEHRVLVELVTNAGAREVFIEDKENN